MKFLVVAVLFAVACGAVFSTPVFDEFQDEAELDEAELDELYAAQDQNDGVRQRRLTCDLLSVGGSISLGDSACAANCLSMGKAGGRCSSGVCQCRQTTFKELWDKRFG